MWGGSKDQIERGFRIQFERDHERIYFRKSGRGRPVPVTEEEMERSVAAFLRRARIVMIAGVTLMIGAVATSVVIDDRLLQRDGAIWALIGLGLVPFLAGFWWAWKSPTIQFEQRTPVGAERSRTELRKKMLAERGWGELLGLGASAAVLSAIQINHWPPQLIEEWIWAGLGLVVTVATGFSVIMKWRFGTSQGPH